MPPDKYPEDGKKPDSNLVLLVHILKFLNNS
jgi:hypothetical protein